MCHMAQQQEWYRLLGELYITDEDGQCLILAVRGCYGLSPSIIFLSS